MPRVIVQVVNQQLFGLCTQRKNRACVAEAQGHRQRGSPMVEASLLLAECVQHNLRTIAFCKSRKLCELILAYTREILRVSAPQVLLRRCDGQCDRHLACLARVPLLERVD